MTLIGAVAALAGCAADPPRGGQSTGEARSSSEKAAWQSRTLPWGRGSGEVALRKGATDFPAEGPSSVAVASDGEVLILDRWNERVIGVSLDGAAVTRGAVPSDAEHLAASPKAAPGFVMAAWSPLHGKVTLLDRGGSLGEVAIPRELTDTMRIEVGLSHRVAAVSAYQETVQLGSPRAPLDLAAASRTRREGAAFLADGRGVAARVTEANGEIFVYAKDKLGDDEKPKVDWTYSVPGPVSAVRVVGAVGKAICARVERVTQPELTGPLSVDREVLCVEAESGRTLLRRSLGRPGIAAVHEDLAVGGEPPAVAFIRPDEAGLFVERLPLTDGASAAKEVGR